MGEAVAMIAGDVERQRSDAERERDAARRERDAAIAAAWHTAAFMRRRRLPTLRSVLSTSAPAPTIEQARAEHARITALAEAAGQ